jgi:hypothetical protein
MSRLAELESYEAEVVHAARQYIKLRNSQAAKYGLGALHTSDEGKALNAAVKALEEYETTLKVN